MWPTSLALLALAYNAVGLPSGNSYGGAPAVAVKNGTLAGVHSSEYNQDFFLGVPYAQPPVGNLRFRVPQSINTSWTGARSAAQYSPECVGYGSDQWNYPVSEVSLPQLNPAKPTINY